MNILQINSSVRGNQSESTRVANSIVEKLRAAHPEATLRVRDLAADPHPVLDETTLGPCSPRPTSAAPNRRRAWRWTTP